MQIERFGFGEGTNELRNRVKINSAAKGRAGFSGAKRLSAREWLYSVSSNQYPTIEDAEIAAIAWASENKIVHLIIEHDSDAITHQAKR